MDTATLRKLMSDLGDDPEVMRELVDTFLEEGARIARQLMEAAAAGDAKTLNRLAHSLKSTAASFGASELSRLCRDLERESEEGMPAHAASRAQEATEEWERVRAELAAWRLGHLR